MGPWVEGSLWGPTQDTTPRRGLYRRHWISHHTPTASHGLTHWHWGCRYQQFQMTSWFHCVCVYVKLKCLWLLVNHLCPQDSWEIVEGLRGGGLSNFLEPQKQEGYMLKRRKWPMKGWHKVQPDTRQVLKRPTLPHLQWQTSDRWGIFRRRFTTTSFSQSYLTLSRFLLQLKAADMALLSINLIEWAYSVDHPQRSHMWPGSMLSLKAFSGMTPPRYLGMRAEMH